MKVDIHRAGKEDVRDVAVMTGEYRAEMLALSGKKPVSSLQEDKARLSEFLDNADYAIFVARSVRGHPLGLMTVFESCVYADDLNGIIEQLYVRPFYRRRKIARKLLAESCQLAKAKKWRRMVVTLPLFLPESVFAFWENRGFTPSGSRKQWLLM